MRWFGTVLFGWWIVFQVAAADPIRVIKVLPTFLDREGRQSLSPSLYERDAYQAQLRASPEQRAGMRYDVQWKAPASERKNLVLRLELRGSLAHSVEPMGIDQPLKRTGWPEHWSTIQIDPSVCEKLGTIIAWRVSLLRNELRVAEQRSFLWQSEP